MKPRLLLVLFILAALALACYMPIPNAPTTAGTPTQTLDALTAVALTVAADLTSTPGSGTPGEGTATLTASPGPSATNAPPTDTRVPPTNTPQPCDQVGFLQDVTIPDGTKMGPGTTFTKTWRLRNLGTCTWTSSYAVVFFGGDPLGAPQAVNLLGDVSPNSIVDVTVTMRAPNSPGKYISYWKLRNPQGQTFALPEGQAFFVQIEVVPQTPTFTVTPTPTVTPTLTNTLTPTLAVQTQTAPASAVVYDFAARVCDALWQTAAGSLTCPGNSADPGYVMRLENPRLETGANESAPVLLTQPQTVQDGVITGTFPAVAIQQGYHFRATLGCLDGATQCAVRYQLNYTVGAQTSNLGQWDQVYDGSVQGIDVDLSALAGQNVQLSLVVLANGPAAGDQALWVNPRIVRQYVDFYMVHFLRLCRKK